MKSKPTDMLSPEQIAQGEELLSKSTPGEWTEHSEDGMLAVDVWIESDGKRMPMSWDNMKLVVWMKNHAPELLQAAKRVEELETALYMSVKMLESLGATKDVIEQTINDMKISHPEYFKK